MTAVITFLFRIAAGLIGLFILFGLLALALLSTLIFVVWSLVRGRRPRIDLSRFQQVRRGSMGRKPFARTDDVVDVEAREVPDLSPGLSDHSSGIVP